jgi:pyrroline-5-carboxylate reductase
MLSFHAVLDRASVLLAQTSTRLVVDEEHLKAIVIIGGFGIAFVAIITNAIRSTVSTRAREQSRREIAAYVAEGSISPDDAAKLLADNDKPSCRGKRA